MEVLRAPSGTLNLAIAPFFWNLLEGETPPPFATALTITILMRDFSLLMEIYSILSKVFIASLKGSYQERALKIELTLEKKSLNITKYSLYC